MQNTPTQIHFPSAVVTATDSNIQLFKDVTLPLNASRDETIRSHGLVLHDQGYVMVRRNDSRLVVFNAHPLAKELAVITYDNDQHKIIDVHYTGRNGNAG